MLCMMVQYAVLTTTCQCSASNVSGVSLLSSPLLFLFLSRTPTALASECYGLPIKIGCMQRHLRTIVQAGLATLIDRVHRGALFQ